MWGGLPWNKHQKYDTSNAILILKVVGSCNETKKLYDCELGNDCKEPCHMLYSRHPGLLSNGSREVGVRCILQPVAWQHKSITKCSDQAMAGSPITGDNAPPHIQSKIDMSAKSLSLTTTYIKFVESNNILISWGKWYSAAPNTLKK